LTNPDIEGIITTVEAAFDKAEHEKCVCKRTGGDSTFSLGTRVPFYYFFRSKVMLDKLKSMFKSRRFWIGVSGMVVICADTLFGAGTVNPETVQMVTLLAAAWIVGDSLRVTA